MPGLRGRVANLEATLAFLRGEAVAPDRLAEMERELTELRALLEKKLHRLAENQATTTMLTDEGMGADQTEELRQAALALQLEIEGGPPSPRQLPAPVPVELAEDTIRRRVAEGEATLAMLRTMGVSAAQFATIEADIIKLRGMLPPDELAPAPAPARIHEAVPPVRPQQGARVDELRRCDSVAVRAQLAHLSETLSASSELQFVDPSFPPEQSSLGDLDAGRSQHRQGRANSLYWARAQDVPCEGESWCVFNGEPRPSDVSQGMLGDCWFLSALAVLAERPAMVKELIVSAERRHPVGDASSHPLNPHGASSIYPVHTIVEFARPR
jgi:hypothetical protein